MRVSGVLEGAYRFVILGNAMCLLPKLGLDRVDGVGLVLFFADRVCSGGVGTLPSFRRPYLWCVRPPH